MSRSKKDGVGGGGHKPHRNDEAFWMLEGKRLPTRAANDVFGRRQTHRFERRSARQAIRAAWDSFRDLFRPEPSDVR